MIHRGCLHRKVSENSVKPGHATDWDRRHEKQLRQVWPRCQSIKNCALYVLECEEVGGGFVGMEG